MNENLTLMLLWCLLVLLIAVARHIHRSREVANFRKQVIETQFHFHTVLCLLYEALRPYFPDAEWQNFLLIREDIYEIYDVSSLPSSKKMIWSVKRLTFRNYLPGFKDMKRVEEIHQAFDALIEQYIPKTTSSVSL